MEGTLDPHKSADTGQDHQNKHCSEAATIHVLYYGSKEVASFSGCHIALLQLSCPLATLIRQTAHSNEPLYGFPQPYDCTRVLLTP